MHLLDTNAVIYHLDGDPVVVPVIKNIFAQGMPVYISAVTEAELFSFSKLTAEDIALIEQLIDAVSVISVDSQIARLAGVTRRTYRLSLSDSFIAATALFTGSILLTRNMRDFRKVVGLHLLKI